MFGLIGKKIGMTQIFNPDGTVVPVTVVQAGPCRVVMVRNQKETGRTQVQLGFMDIPEKKCTKPVAGHFKKQGQPASRVLKEVALPDGRELKPGDLLNADEFTANETIHVIGVSKGRGFSGTIKRHGFHGFSSTHGVHESFRGPGSIGQCATPGRVFKGKKMAGHYGVDQITVRNLKVVRVDAERNLLLIRGAVPGHRNSLVFIRKAQ